MLSQDEGDAEQGVKRGEGIGAARRRRKRERCVLNGGAEGAVPPTPRTPKLGRLTENQEHRFRESRRLASANHRSGLTWWRETVKKEIESAAATAVQERDWARALALLSATLKTTYRAAMTFIEASLQPPRTERFPIETLLAQTLSHLEGGEVQQQLVESLQADQDDLRARGNAFFYYVVKLLTLIEEGDVTASLTLIDTIQKRPAYRYKYATKKWHFVLLRVVVLYAVWVGSLKDDDPSQSSSRGTSRERISRAPTAATRAAEAIWSAVSSRLNTCPHITLYCIYIHIVFWLGHVDTLPEATEFLSNGLPFHADAHLMCAATLCQLPRHQVAEEHALIQFLKIHPHEQKAVALLKDAETTEADAEGVSTEAVTALVMHLDVCHPDFKPLEECLAAWTQFRSLLKKPWSDYQREQIRQLLMDRAVWWRQYFFSPFSIKTLLRTHGKDSISELLCVLGRVACHLYERQQLRPFLKELKAQLEPRLYKKIQQTERRIDRHPEKHVLL